MKIAVLALQGAFIEHEKKLEQLGATCIELRQKSDLDQDFDGLVLPGGESTVQGKLLKELDMFDDLQKRIQDGLPTLATCAGLILLADRIVNQDQTYFSTIPMTVKRNAYGRQLGSFHTIEEMKGLGKVPMTFIRAPYIESVQEGVDILSEVNDHIIAVQYKNQLALAFHPELDENHSIHQYFINMIKKSTFFLYNRNKGSVKMNHHIEVVNSNIKYPIIFYNHFFNQNRPVTSHFHKDVEVVYIVSGKLEAYIDGKNEIFHQGEMFIVNSHVIHQFIFLEETHIYTYLLSIDVFNEFNIKYNTFKLRTPLDVEWMKPWLEMKNCQELASLDKHILMYQLYQKIIQDCLIEIKKETKLNDISFILDEIEKK